MNNKLRIFTAVVLSVSLVLSFLIHPSKVSCIDINCKEINDDFENRLKSMPLIVSRNLVKSTAFSNIKVENVVSHISFFGELSVDASFKKPIIGIVADKGETSIYSDKGEYLGVDNSFSGNKVKAYSKFDIDKTIFLISLANEIFKLLPVTKASIENNSLNFATSTNVEALYPLQGDIDILLGRTVLVFSQLNGNPEKFNIVGEDGKPKKVSQVDFRFDKPVLR